MSFVDDVKSRLRVDGFVNLLTGLGGTRDRSVRSYVQGVVPLTPTELEALYHGSDLPGKIVDALPTDAMRQGILTGDPDLDRAIERWKALDLFLDAWIWGRLYGQGALVLGFSDLRGKVDQPLDWSTIREGDLQFIMPVEAQDLAPADYIEDRTDPRYGEARTYRIGSSTDARVHSSRLLLFGGARTSPRVKARNSGRDLSVLQRPYEVLRDVDSAWRAVMLLMQDLSQAVFKIKDLASMVANGQGQIAMDRMALVDIARSVARAVVIDAESESFEHVGAANLTGVDPLLVRVFTRLAAAADMPVTILMGMSPAGMNATGEADIRIWYAKVGAARRDALPNLRKLIWLIARTEGLHEAHTLQWPSLWDATEQEQAALELTRAQGAQIRIGSQMTTPAEERVLWATGQEPSALDTESEADSLDVSAAITTALPEPDSIWIDTFDAHKIQVNAVSGGKVYCQDLSSETPDLQYSWALTTFLDRCRPLPPAIA